MTSTWIIVAGAGLVLAVLAVVMRRLFALLETKAVKIEKLRSIDDMKNGILNAVSHELRTPLTYIKGTAYMLRDPTLPDDIKQDLVRDLVTSADRLEEALTGLLDFGRLDRGTLPISGDEERVSSYVRGSRDFRSSRNDSL